MIDKKGGTQVLVKFGRGRTPSALGVAGVLSSIGPSFDREANITKEHLLTATANPDRIVSRWVMVFSKYIEI